VTTTRTTAQTSSRTSTRTSTRTSLWSRWGIWAVYAAVLAIAPLIWTSSLSMTMLTQIGIAIIACLAYNVLLGQGGMLSFGHAVYSGLGSFFAIHTLNMIGDGRLALPVSLVPLVGGVFGLLMAALLGYVTTKKAGTPFAMITLGLGELVWSMSLMFPGFFGGEGGITGDRTSGQTFLGITFGPARQLYYLIAVYCFVSTVLLYAFTRTPLGRILNAVRDNPERVEFVGYRTQAVRYLAFMVSGFFMGIAGGLGALNFEIVTAEVVGAGRSGAYLLFTFLGGAGFFIGPIIGAVLMVLALVMLSELTNAWLLYLGLIFLFMVMYAPGGFASLIMMNLRMSAFGKLRPLAGLYTGLALTALVMFASGGALIEMVYHLQLNTGVGPEVSFLKVPLDTSAWSNWLGVLALLVVGVGLFEVVRRRFAARWSQAQTEIELALQRKEPA
jgi:branched-chain amino acid transport system permease protein